MHLHNYATTTLYLVYSRNNDQGLTHFKSTQVPGPAAPFAPIRQPLTWFPSHDFTPKSIISPHSIKENHLMEVIGSALTDAQAREVNSSVPKLPSQSTPLARK